MDEDDEVNAWIEDQINIGEYMIMQQALTEDAKKLEAFGVDPMTGEWYKKGVYLKGRAGYAPDQTALPTVLAERNKTHGDYTHQADLCQQLKTIVHVNFGSLSPVQLDALEMICVKISRILAGDPNHKDSWLDIAGYATLVADRIGE